MGKGGRGKGGGRTNSVLVRNLNYRTHPDTVREKFEKYGDIKDVYLPEDYKTGKPRGFGFVEYYDSRDADDACDGMHNRELDGNEITCVRASDRRKSPHTMRKIIRDRRDDGGRGGRDRRSRNWSRSRSRDRRRRDDSRDRRDRRSRSRSRDRRRRSRSGDNDSRDRRDDKSPRREEKSPRREEKDRSVSMDRAFEERAAEKAERRSESPRRRSESPRKSRSPRREERSRSRGRSASPNNRD